MGTENKVRKNPQNTVSCPSPNMIQMQNTKVKLANKMVPIKARLLLKLFLNFKIIKEAVQKT